MENISKIIWWIALSSSLVFWAPVSDTISYNKEKVENTVKSSVIQSDIDILNGLFLMSDEYLKKDKEIKSFLEELYNKGNSNLYWMWQLEFLKLLDLTYWKNTNIEKIESKFSKESFDIMYRDQTKILEKNLDALFMLMFESGEINRGLTYMTYIDNHYWYNNENFINERFDLNFYLKHYGNDELEKIIETIKKTEYDEVKKIIDNMNNDTFKVLINSDNSDNLSQREIKSLEYLMNLIQNKLRQIYIK